MKLLRHHKRLATMLAIVLICVILFWPIILVKIHSEADELEGRLQLIERAVSGLERLVDHQFVIGEGFNLDGVFTMRIFKDQLAAFLQHVVEPSKDRIKDSRLVLLTERVTALHQKGKQFVEIYTQSVKRNYPQYFQNMGFWLIAGSWEMWNPQRNIDRNSMPNYGFEKTINDSVVGVGSDLCMMEPYFNQCKTTEVCWNRMAHLFHNGFSLTHEILFIMNILALGCEKEASISSYKFKNMSPDELMTKECTVVLHEAELIAQRNYPSYHRDLFMEQAAFCGMLGFRDFFRDEWLDVILSWQRDVGCFSNNFTAAGEEMRRDFPNYTFLHHRQYRRSLDATGTTLASKNYTWLVQYRDVNYNTFHMSVTRQSHHRQKRTESVMADGCFAHMTGVAVVALGQYVRFFLEPLLRE